MYIHFFNSTLMRPPPLLRTWLRLCLIVRYHTQINWCKYDEISISLLSRISISNLKLVRETISYEKIILTEKNYMPITDLKSYKRVYQD